jgi:hypothetical protein
MKCSPLVVIGISRRGGGRDNGARSCTEVGVFSELRLYGIRGTARLERHLQFHVLLAVRSDHRSEYQLRRCPNLRGPT